MTHPGCARAPHLLWWRRAERLALELEATPQGGRAERLLKAAAWAALLRVAILWHLLPLGLRGVHSPSAHLPACHAESLGATVITAVIERVSQRFRDPWSRRYPWLIEALRAKIRADSMTHGTLAVNKTGRMHVSTEAHKQKLRVHALCSCTCCLGLGGAVCSNAHQTSGQPNSSSAKR